MTFDIAWLDSGREPQCKPNPDYPKGRILDIRELSADPHRRSCETDLPYPAPRCGLYIVSCQTCGLKTAITTAGRPYDPCKLIVSCKLS